jgi:NitT/TauT family transport system substrate-binding protein
LGVIRVVWLLSRRRLAVICTSLLVAAGGCGGGATPRASSGGTPVTQPTGGGQAHLTEVTLQFPWLISGEDAPFYVARQKGFYRDAGLDVHFNGGTSSLQAAEVVANGKAQFGFSDASAVAGVISEGGNEQMVAQVDDRSPVGIITHAGQEIRTPADLTKLTILANSAGGPVTGLLYAVLAKAGIPRSRVHVNIVATSAEVSSFHAKRNDALLGFANATYVQALGLEPSAKFTPYARFGINPLSFGIVANGDMIRQHPDEVRAFVAASIRGLQYAAAHPEEAAQIEEPYSPQMSRQVLIRGLQYTLDYTDQPQGKPFGYAEQRSWADTLSVLHAYGGLRTVKSPGAYFTNQFVTGA